MLLIDTHAHLDDERFAADLPEVLRRAAEAGVERIVAVATTAASSHACAALAERYPILAPSAGIHPNSYAQAGPADWDEIVALAKRPRTVALGETGLDRHWHDTPFDKQEENFARHLDLSRETGLPVIIHSRECDADMLRMLRAEFDRFGPLNAVMHSFSSGSETAAACVAMGLYISFAGMLTYKNAADLRAAAATIPADRILVETDCPYLTPMPHRGKRNEPAYAALTAACLAEVRGISAEGLGEQTTSNAKSLFARL